MEAETRVDALVDRWEEMRDVGTPITVEELCAGSPDLVAEVHRRIEALRAMDSALDTEVSESRSAGAGRDTRGDEAYRDLPEVSQATSVYRLRGHHDQGGLGVVLIARQEELDRTVALKRIRPDRSREATRRRFLREATITAGLQHPGIVPIYGLGRDDAGPFYTMPFIRGQTLQQAIAAFHGDEALRRDPGRRDLRLRGLLQPFITACNTMAYAHARGVVHRDLKPSNLMLGPYGETLVMDWGLAKRLVGDEAASDDGGADPSPGPSSEEVTATGEVLGTPLYMSPEQARGESAGPASDIFSLGLILYAILTGRSAFEGAKAGGADRLEAVRRAAIVPPRRVDPRLPGDLDAICLKALAPSPSGRYVSARDLADDLNRWLADEPVTARREPVSARARRWGRRHRTIAAAASVALVAFAIGMGAVAAVQVRSRDRVEKARDETLRALHATLAAEAKTRAALDQSEESRAQAEAVSRFLVEAFRSPDPSQVDRNVKVVDVLDRACTRLEKEFDGSPATRGALLDAMGRTHEGLGWYDRAAELLIKARAVREAALGPDHPDTLGTLNSLAVAHYDAGHLKEAIGLYREALARAEPALGPDHPRTLGLRSNLAVAYHYAGRWDEAIAIVKETLARREATLGPDHPDTLASRNNLAFEYWSAGRLDEAIALYRGILQRLESTLGPDHPDTLRSRHGLAVATHAAGHLAEAIALFEGVIKQQGAKLGPDHPDTLASRNSLASAYLDVGRVGDAIALHESTLALRESRLGRDHLFTLASRSNLAACYVAAGRFPEAIALHESTVASMAANQGPDLPTTLEARCHLANSYAAAGRLREAIALHEATLAIQEAKLGPDHFDALASRLGLAAAYRAAGRPVEAAELHAAILGRYEARLGPDHPDALECRGALAADVEEMGRRREAERLHREVLDRRRRSVPPGSPLLAADLARLARNLVDQGKGSEAEPMLRAALAIFEKATPDDWRRHDALSLLGSALMGQGRYAGAESPIVAGYEGLKAREARIPAPERPRLREAAERVVHLYERWGRPAEADAWKIKVGMRDLPADVFTGP